MPKPDLLLTPGPADAGPTADGGTLPSLPLLQGGGITTNRIITYLFRLTETTYSTGAYFHYTYDAAGNRLTQTTPAGATTYSYNAANRLIQVNGQSYTYDNNGNLLSDGSRTFTYDSANRLTSVIDGAVTTQFEYDGDGD